MRDNLLVASRDLGVRIGVRLKAAGCAVTAEQRQLLCSYLGLLANWNRKISLTSLKVEPATDEALDRLVVEAVSASRLVRRTAGLAIDLGSGGGSPAIPLKIACPYLRMVMVESKVRKSAFLRDVVRHLKLSDTDVLNCRIEELLARPELAQSADIVSIRAVRADEALWSQVHGLLHPGGSVMWFRSASPVVSGDPHPLLRLESTYDLLPVSGSVVSILKPRG